MSVILKTPSGADVQINMWHWRPTMLLVRQVLDLDEQRFEMLQSNGVGAAVSAKETELIADFLDGYLADFPKEGRLLMDGSITQEQKTYKFDQKDWDRNYSASSEWLARFRDFCRASGGFKVI
jgi:hypothetical protein